MELFDRLFHEIGPLLPGLIAAVVFIGSIVGLRFVVRDGAIRDKLRFPTSLFGLYLVLFVLLVLARLYLPVVARPLSIVSLFVLALAVILALSVGVVDLFLGKYRHVQVSTIVRDVGVLVVYVVAIFILLGQQGVNLTSILTTSAVLTAVVGFALQDLLSSIIAGLALQVERPFKSGDWVMFDEQEGQVLEVNWRSTKILTVHRDIVVIPNNVITRSALVNFSAPTRVHRRKVVVGLRYEAPPNVAKRSIMKAVTEAEGVLEDPPPFVLLKSFDDFAVTYRVHFFIEDFPNRERIEDDVRTRIWYQLRRDGLSIPFPIRDVNVRQVTVEEEDRAREAELAHVVAALERVPFLEPLSSEERRRLAGNVKREHYARGETVLRQGSAGDSFYVIAAGAVEVLVGEELRPVATLARHDFFGEMSLMTGEPRSATIVATEDAELYVIDKRAFESVIVSNEGLVAKISERLESRRDSLTDAEEGGVAETGREAADAKSSLVNRIRRFFSL